VEPPQGRIPTFVWFDRINVFYSVLPHALYFSDLLGVVSQGAVEDWKGSLSANICAGIADKKQLVSQVVQCGPAILENISSEHRDSAGHVLDVIEVTNQLSRFEIRLTPDRIWSWVRPTRELGDLNLQITEMLIGPLNSY
jgi:hypothetical protein